jgi:hypothetical protein
MKKFDAVQMGHTPGPWKISCNAETHRASPDSFRIHSVNEPATTIATVSGEEGAANALLIHAAPDLLAAIEEVITYSGGAPTVLEDEYVMQRVMNAFHRAGGQD